MKTIGNIIWFVFGGLIVAIQYIVASFALMATIIGIPWGVQNLKLAWVALWPFGKETPKVETDYGFLYWVMNVVWFFIGGVWIALTHLFFGVLFCITIIGIPFGKQHFKLASLALSPFGRTVIER